MLVLILKSAHRSMQFCTMYREVALKWAASEQAKFFDKGVRDFFGCKLNLLKTARCKKNVCNAYTLCLSRMNSTAVGMKPFWGSIRDSTKDCIRNDALDSNVAQDEVHREDVKKILKNPIVGQFGGYDRDQPFNEDEVHVLLNSDDPDLREKWKTKSISEFKNSLEKTKERFSPSYDDINAAGGIMLEGERCGKCKKSRLRTMGEYSYLRQRLLDHYHTEEGKKSGIVIGFIFLDSPAVWRHIVLVKRRPEQFYSISLELLSMDSQTDDVHGDFDLPIETRWDMDSCMGPDYKLCLIDLLASFSTNKPIFCVILDVLSIHTCPDNGWVTRYAYHYQKIDFAASPVSGGENQSQNAVPKGGVNHPKTVSQKDIALYTDSLEAGDCTLSDYNMSYAGDIGSFPTLELGQPDRIIDDDQYSTPSDSDLDLPNHLMTPGERKYVRTMREGAHEEVEAAGTIMSSQINQNRYYVAACAPMDSVTLVRFIPGGLFGVLSF